jgi:hypothetical protein
MHLVNFHPAGRRTTARWLAVAAVLAFGLVASAAQARAEFFTFNTTVNPTSVTTGGGVTVTLTPQSVDTPGDNLDATFPGTDLVFGSISVSGLTLGSGLEAVVIPYTFHVAVSNYLQGTDAVPTGPPVTFDVSGTLSGTVGAGKKVNIANSFGQPILFQFVGGEPYQLSAFSYVPPGVANSGAFGAHVEVVRVPEPGSMAMLGLGVLFLATPAFLRRRRISPRSGG